MPKRKRELSEMEVKWFSILGVESTASEKDIEKAYRKKILKLHPDKNPDKDTTEETKELNNAYDYLKQWLLKNENSNNNDDEPSMDSPFSFYAKRKEQASDRQPECFHSSTREKGWHVRCDSVHVYINYPQRDITFWNIAYTCPIVSLPLNQNQRLVNFLKEKLSPLIVLEKMSIMNDEMTFSLPFDFSQREAVFGIIHYVYKVPATILEFAKDKLESVDQATIPTQQRNFIK